MFSARPGTSSSPQGSSDGLARAGAGTGRLEREAVRSRGSSRERHRCSRVAYRAPSCGPDSGAGPACDRRRRPEDAASARRARGAGERPMEPASAHTSAPGLGLRRAQAAPVTVRDRYRGRRTLPAPDITLRLRHQRHRTGSRQQPARVDDAANAASSSIRASRSPSGDGRAPGLSGLHNARPRGRFAPEPSLLARLRARVRAHSAASRTPPCDHCVSDSAAPVRPVHERRRLLPAASATSARR